MEFWIIVTIIILLIIFIKQVNQYEKGVIFTLGKFTGIKESGWRIVVPIFQAMRKVDMRTKAVDVPNQEVITKDNVPVSINAVIYYKICNAEKAILSVENFKYAVSQLAQTSMKNAVGEKTFDELLQSRTEIAIIIKENIRENTQKWGVEVETLELKDVIIPENLKRTISKEAEAEREKRAVIIKADGDRIAAENLALAAEKLSGTTGAMHLRTLQALNDLSSDQSNTIVFAIPVDVLQTIKGYADVINQKK